MDYLLKGREKHEQQPQKAFPTSCIQQLEELKSPVLAKSEDGR